MSKRKKVERYYTNEIDLSNSISFPFSHNFKYPNKEKESVTIIGGKVSNNLTDMLMRFIVPDYLIKLYENYQAIEVLEEINVNSYIKKIIENKNYSIFNCEDYIREDPNEDNLLFFETVDISDKKEKELKEIKDEIISVNSSEGSTHHSSKKLIINDDWENIINISYVFSRKTLTILVVKGIPKEMRSQFWFLISGAKHEMEQNPLYYKFLLNKYPVPLQSEKQIELDLRRTFPNDSFFENQENLEKLKNILLAYSRRNVSIGYIQGFNMIVGKILKQTENEEQTFYIFMSLLENKLPLNFFSEMCGVMADVDIMIKILNILCPNLYNHLLDYELLDYLGGIFLQWFVSLFTYSFNESYTTFIFDLFFVQGSVVLFKFAYFLLKECEPKLMTATSIYDVKMILERDNDAIFNENELSEIRLKMIQDFVLDERILNINRSRVSKYIEANIRTFNLNKIETKKNEIKKKEIDGTLYCDIEWPICLYNAEAFYEISDVLILQCMTSISNLIIENYYYIDHKDQKYITPRKIKIDDEVSNITQFSFRKESNNKELLVDNLMPIKCLSNFEELSFEDALLERRQHTETCKKKHKLLNEIELKNKLIVKYNPINNIDEFNHNLIGRKSELDSKVNNNDKIKSLKNKNKAVSTIFQPTNKMTCYESSENSDFNQFISNLKLRYFKVSQSKDVYLKLIESNRKQMK